MCRCVVSPPELELELQLEVEVEVEGKVVWK